MGLQRREQVLGGGADRFHGVVEHVLGGCRWPPETTDRPHILERGSAQILVGHLSGIGGTQDLDAAAHGSTVRPTGARPVRYTRITASGTKLRRRAAVPAGVRQRYEGYGWSLGTMVTPSGTSEIGMILKLASPSGIPMMVRHSSTPVTRCPSASHQPNRMIQRMLPSSEPRPASRRGSMARPKGHST